MRGLPVVLALFVATLFTKPLLAQDPCVGEIFITDPVCGANFIDQPTITLRGFVRNAQGTVLLSVSSLTDGIRIPIVRGPGECPDTPFEVSIPLNCGCTVISALLEENPAVITRHPIHVHQGPPIAFIQLPGRTVRVGGCSEADEAGCLGLSCGGAPGGGSAAPLPQCGGGSETCFTTSVASVSGSVATSDSTMTVIGPLNTIQAVVESAPSLAPSDILIHRWTASGLQLASGQNSVMFRQQTGSVVSTRAETLCVDLNVPPRVCLTFLWPSDLSFVSTAATTVVGHVTPRDASVRLTHGLLTQQATPDTTGAFALPVMLTPGANLLRLDAEQGSTLVSVSRTVTLQTTTPPTGASLFVSILRPVAYSTVTTMRVPVEGLSRPGASITVQSPGNSLFTAAATDGTWSTVLPVLVSGLTNVTALASLDGQSATSSVSFTVQSTSQGGPTTGLGERTINTLTVYPRLAGVGSRVDVLFTLTGSTNPPPPGVTVGSQPATLHTTRGPLWFRFSRVLDGTEAEGPTTAVVTVGSLTASTPLVTDLTRPSLGNLSVAPIAGTTGTTVSVAFTVSETLAGQPLVTIGGAPTRLTTVAGLTYSFVRTLAPVPPVAIMHVGNEPPENNTVAVAAASDGGRVAIATTGLTPAMPSVRVFDATDPAARRLITWLSLGQTVERVYMEGDRLIVAYRDVGLGVGLSELLGVDVTAPLAGNLLFTLSRLTGLSQPNLLPNAQLETTWILSSITNHRQVEIAGELLVALDEDPALHTRSINASSIRALYESRLQEDQYRTPIIDASHISIAKTAPGTFPVLAVVRDAGLSTYRINERYRLIPVSTTPPSVGVAERVFCGEGVGVLTRASGGVDLLDLTDPAVPVRRGSLSVGSAVLGAAFDRQRIILATATDLVTVDSSDLDAPVVLGTTSLSQPLTALTAERPIVATQGTLGHGFFDLALRDVEGPLGVRVMTRDRAGNAALDATRTVTADYTPPRLTRLDVSPDPASRGTTLTLEVHASELLEGPPVVLVADRAAIRESSSSLVHRFHHVVDGADVEGIAEIEVRMRDLVGIAAVDRTGRVTFDFTPPAISDVSLEPQSARAGTTAVVSFSVSELLRSTPAVTIGGNPATLVSQQDQRYVFRRSIDGSEVEGSAEVVVQAVDRAGNTALQSVATLETDFTPPVISEQVVSPAIGRVGTVVAVSFSVNETLGSTPSVQLGGQPMDLHGRDAGSYEFRRTLDGSEVEGQAAIRIAAEDRAGNARIDTSLALRTDFTPPAALHATVLPTLLSVGRTLLVTFSASESLATTPVVEVGSRPMRLSTSRQGLDFCFDRLIDGSEGEGLRAVSVRLTDEAGNVAAQEVATVRFDFTAPAFANVIAAPALASHGTTVTLDFTSSEQLAAAPVVTVGQQATTLVTSSGTTHRFRRVIDGGEGEGMPAVEISGSDPAGNTGTGSFTPLSTDFTAPVAQSISVAPSPATTGTTVTVAFTASEALRAQPEVSIDSRPAELVSEDALRFVFRRRIDGTEREGAASVRIALMDSAGNQGLSTSTVVVLDYRAPQATFVSIDPSSARRGTTVTVVVSVDEPLREDPSLTIGGRPSSLVDTQGLVYRFQRVLDATDAEGRPPLAFRSTDLAGNAATVLSTELVTDVTPPALTVSADPTLARRGTTVTVAVEAAEDLAGTPTVTLANLAVEAIGQEGRRYTFRRTLDGNEPEGLLVVRVVAADRAGNETTDESARVTADFTSPTFTSLSAAPAVATTGTTVTLTFQTSEPLNAAPDVQVGGQPCTLVDLQSATYRFTRRIEGNEGEGTPSVTVRGRDPAGNVGDLTARAVTLDFTKPEAHSLSVSPSPATTGTTVTASFTASEELSGTPLVSVNGRPFALAASEGQTFQFTRRIDGSEGEGQRVVDVQLRDVPGNVGHSTASLELDFTSPVLTFQSVDPSFARAGTTVVVEILANEALSTGPSVAIADRPFVLVSQAGSVFRFERTLDGSETTGVADLATEATDRAGNRGGARSGALTIDFLAPTFRAISVEPQLARTGTTVTIRFDLSEAATAHPHVSVGGRAATFVSQSGLSYQFDRAVDGSEGEGSMVVRLDARDLAGNEGVDESARLTTDFTPPVFSSLSAEPASATTGTTVTLTFQVSEPLASAPTARIGEHACALVDLQGSTYRFARRITGDEGEGTPPVVLRGVDRAGNPGELEANPLTLDFTRPSAVGISVSPSPATTGTTVAATFTASEALSATPLVSVNGRPFVLATNDGLSFHFTRRIDGSEGEGDRTVSVELQDVAGNTGRDAASLALDFTSPVLTFQSVAPSFARTGTTVVVEVSTNELLSSGPTVAIANRPFALVSQTGSVYRFERTLDGAESEGTPDLLAEGVDRPGNLGSARSRALTVDYTPPTFASINVSPSLVASGASVEVRLRASEPLASAPAVTLGGQPAALAGVSDRDYTFRRVIDGQEGEGSVVVAIAGVDRAGNPGRDETSRLTTDFAAPQPTSISLAPSLARSGTTVTVSFGVSESLDTTPTVRFEASPFDFAGIDSGRYTFRRQFDGSEREGDQPVQVSLKDPAGNESTTGAGVVRTDFTRPDATNTSVAPTIARTGTLVRVQFESTETLVTTPTVTLAGFALTPQVQAGAGYLFERTVDGSEPEGTQPVHATLVDLAGNDRKAALGEVRIDYTAPRFAPVVVTPTLATTGTLAVVSFTASETLTGTPTVSVGASVATLHTRNGNQYTFRSTIDGTEGEGFIAVRVLGRDVAGNVGEDSTARITTDFTPPRADDIQVAPLAGKKGTRIALSFAGSEALTGTPRAFLGDQPFALIGMESGRFQLQRALDGVEGEGGRPTRVELTDLAGNTSTTAGPAVRTDFTTPTATELSVAPEIGRIGTTIVIQLASSEALGKLPIVLVGGQQASLTTSSSSSFLFERSLTGQETEGTARVDVLLEDLVGNVGRVTHDALQADFTTPSISNVQITTGPHSVGSIVIVTLTVSESIQTTPHVGLPMFAPIAQDGNTFVFERTIDGTEPEGEISVPIAVIDHAGNIGHGASGVFVTDFTSPRVVEVRASPSPATVGTTIAIDVRVNEPMFLAPNVLFSGLPATLVSSAPPSYTYAYTVTDRDEQGLVPIEVQMIDRAGNYATDLTGSVIIDFSSPQPEIAYHPHPGREGSEVFFSGLPSRDVSGIASYRWSFDGLAISTAPVAHFAFPDGPTTRTIELSVTDRVGLSATTQLLLPIVNVSPTIRLDPVTSAVSASVPITWRTSEPGAADAPVVSIVAADLVSKMRTELTTRAALPRFDWDTTTAKESIFQLFLTVRDKDGGLGTTASGPIIVNNHELTIEIKGAQPRYFNPAFEEGTLLTYMLSEHANVSVRLIRSRDRTPVATLIHDARQFEGANSVPWNGLDPATTSTIMPDGEYGYVVEGRDLAGGRSTASSLDAGIVVVLDTIAPAQPTVDPVPVLLSKPFLTLSGTTDQGTSVRVLSGTDLLASAPFTAVTTGVSSTTWTATVRLSEGLNELRIHARDQAGNLSTAVVAQTTLDATPPSAPVITSLVPLQTQADTLEIAGTKDADATLVVNGNPRPLSASTSWTETFPLRAFLNTFRFHVVDGAGNSSSEVTTSTFRIPNTVGAPTAKVPLATRFATLAVTGSKPADTSLSLRLAPSSQTSTQPLASTTSWGAEIQLVEGPNTLFVMCHDAIGSPSEERAFPIVRDSVPPLIQELAQSANVVTTNTSPLIGFRVTDQGSGVDLDSVRLSVDNVNVTTRAQVADSTVSVSGMVVSTGTHFVQAEASDRAGNLTSKAWSFYVHPPDDGRPPVVTINAVRNTHLTPAYNSYSPEHEARTRVEFVVNVPATGVLRVRTESGVLIRQASVERTSPTSVNSAAWDGRDDQGFLVKDGVFNLELELVNIFGRVVQPAPVTVKVSY